MTTYVVRLLIDVPNVEAFTDWFYDRHEGVVAEHAGQPVVEVDAAGDSAAEASRTLVTELERFAGLTVIGVDLDLVNTTDISERAGVSRQAVRQWVTGETGPGDFPRALGVPGRSQVWDWGTVNEWLRSLGQGDDEAHLTFQQACQLQAWLMDRHGRDYATAASAAVAEIRSSVGVHLMKRWIGAGSTGSAVLPAVVLRIEAAGSFEPETMSAGSILVDEIADYLETHA